MGEGRQGHLALLVEMAAPRASMVVVVVEPMAVVVARLPVAAVAVAHHRLVAVPMEAVRGAASQHCQVVVAAPTVAAPTVAAPMGAARGEAALMAAAPTVAAPTGAARGEAALMVAELTVAAPTVAARAAESSEAGEC